MPSVVPLIPVHLDRERTLRFDRRAVFTAERELTRLWGTPTTFYGSMVELMDAIATGQVGKLSVNTIAVLVWQGLLHESPTLTLDETQDLLPYLDLLAMVQICGALLQAWNVATQPAEPSSEAAGGTNGPLASLTGSPSGALSVGNSG